MEIFLAWPGFVVIVGFLASGSDRSIVGWPLLALLVPGFIVAVLLLVLGQAGKNCPQCAETCRKGARACRHLRLRTRIETLRPRIRIEALVVRRSCIGLMAGRMRLLEPPGAPVAGASELGRAARGV